MTTYFTPKGLIAVLIFVFLLYLVFSSGFGSTDIHLQASVLGKGKTSVLPVQPSDTSSQSESTDQSVSSETSTTQSTEADEEEDNP